MFRHLMSYQENFINVIDGRDQRDDLKKEVVSYIKNIRSEY